MVESLKAQWVRSKPSCIPFPLSAGGSLEHGERLLKMFTSWPTILPPLGQNTSSCWREDQGGAGGVRRLRWPSSRGILAKTIDGLEQSSIVKTSPTICMMAGEESSKSFHFQNSRFDGEKMITEKEKKPFFRNSKDMEDEILKGNSNTHRVYLGNLRQQSAFITLKKDFMCIRDCETNGTLRMASKETMVFMKLLKCEDEFGNKNHLPLCLRCNNTDKAKAIMNSVRRTTKINEKFKKENIKACIHSKVAELLFTSEISKKVDEEETNCKIVIDDYKKHLSISFDGKSHGLIFVNRAKKGNKGNCCKCKSIRCKHVQVWNKEMKREVIKDKESDVISTEDENNRTSDEGNCNEENGPIGSNVLYPRLDYPYTLQTQEKLRKSDGSKFEDLVELVSTPEEDEKCIHKHRWSMEDPCENDWIYSRNVKISHSTYVTQKERKLFYRKANGDCNCILLYDGKADMLLYSSHHSPQLTKAHTGRLGYRVNLVSISLLADFTNDFFKNGTTITGFYTGYRSKCITKYGMDEKDVIPMIAWKAACVKFLTEILTIDEKEAFQCIDCGPRPKVLVIDGIAMGIMKSELKKQEEEILKDLGTKSHTDIQGSNYNDRMFIKLSRNRKIIKNAAKEKTWPETEMAGDSGSDLEYEVGEKRKKNDHDRGMDQLNEFLKTVDKTSKPSRGIQILMENLSTSTSTVGMMQVYDNTLIRKIELFLKDNKEYNFVTGTENIDLNIEVRKKYPVLMSIIEAELNQDGKLGKPIR